MNLTTTDVEKFQFGGLFVNFLWGAPLESLVILYFGLDLVGVSFLAGFAALALMVPMQVRRAFVLREGSYVRAAGYWLGTAACSQERSNRVCVWVGVYSFKRWGMR